MKRPKPSRSAVRKVDRAVARGWTVRHWSGPATYIAGLRSVRARTSTPPAVIL